MSCNAEINSRKSNFCNVNISGHTVRQPSHEIIENHLDGHVSIGHLAGVLAKIPLSVSFSIVKLGNPWDTGR